MQLMTIEEFVLLDKYKNIKFNQKNIKNIVHQKGEEYMLRALFKGDTIAKTYYAGLDNRTTLQSTDLMTGIVGEPISFNYSRAKIESWEDPTIVNGTYVIKSGFLRFSALAGTWGPVGNIFLSTSKLGGVLISSAKLSKTISVNDGDSIVMVMNLSLTN